MTSNHGFEINAIDSKPIELLLAGGLVLALFQSLAHVRFVFYYGPIISQRNQLFKTPGIPDQKRRAQPGTDEARRIG